KCSVRGEQPREDHVEPHLGWFHRYPARFHHEVLSQMFDGVERRLGCKPKTILDPFVGTGSTLSFAKQHRISSVGVELTPLAVLISKVRLNPLEDVDIAVELAERIASLETQRQTHSFPDELVFWIGKKNALALASYLARIARLQDAKLKRWLFLAVSSALRPSSRWLVGSIKPQVDPERKPSTINRHFLRCARMLKRDCEAEWAEYCDTVETRIYRGNAQSLPLSNASVEAIITSPPYETMYDYFDVHRLSYLAFGWNCELQKQIGRSKHIERDGEGFEAPRHMVNWYRDEYRAEATLDGRALRAYFVSMRRHLMEARRVLRQNGVVAYAVANTFRNGRKFALALALSDAMRQAGFQQVELVRRENSHRRILPAGRDRQTGRFSSSAPDAGVEEYLIFARR